MSNFVNFISERKNTRVFTDMKSIVQDFFDFKIVTVSGAPRCGKSTNIPLVAAVATFAAGDDTPVYVIKRSGFQARHMVECLRRELPPEEHHQLRYNESCNESITQPTVIYTTAAQLLMSGNLNQARNIILDDAHSWGPADVPFLETLFDDDDRRIMVISSYHPHIRDVVASYVEIDENDLSEYVIPERPGRKVIRQLHSDRDIFSVTYEAAVERMEARRGVVVFVASPQEGRRLKQQLITQFTADGYTDYEIQVYLRGNGLPEQPRAPRNGVKIVILREMFADLDLFPWIDCVVTGDMCEEPIIRSHLSSIDASPIDAVALLHRESLHSEVDTGYTHIVTRKNTRGYVADLNRVYSRVSRRRLRDVTKMVYYALQAQLNPMDMTAPDTVFLENRLIKKSLEELTELGVITGEKVKTLDIDCRIPGVDLSVPQATAVKCLRTEIPERFTLFMPLVIALTASDIRISTQDILNYPRAVPSDFIARAATAMNFAHHLLADKEDDGVELAMLRSNVSRSAVMRFHRTLREALKDIPEEVMTFWRNIYNQGFEDATTAEERDDMMLLLFRVFQHRCYRMASGRTQERVVAEARVGSRNFTEVPTAERSLVTNTYSRDRVRFIAGNLKVIFPVTSPSFPILEDMTVFTKPVVDALARRVNPVLLARIMRFVPSRSPNEGRRENASAALDMLLG